jgi:fibronectin type 3 domain-containing protein
MLKQRIIAIIIAICMILTLFPMTSFAASSFKVTFDSQGGSAVTGNPVAVRSGRKVAKPADPALDGFFFRGWYTSTDYAADQKWDFSWPVTASMTLYAKWAKICTVTVSCGDNGNVTGLAEGGLYGEGDKVTLTGVPEKDGYHISAWTLEGSSDPISLETVYKFAVSGDTALHAEFDRIGAAKLSAEASGFKCIKLSWDKISGASGYEIYRSTSSGDSGSLINTVKYGSVTSYLDSVASDTTEYYYKVRAYCKAGSMTSCGDLSDEVSATAQNMKPSVTASPDGYYSIKISWDYVPSAAGYIIYRSASETGTFTKLITISNNYTTYYSNTGLKKGAAYYYRIQAYKGSGCRSEYSDTVSAVSGITAPVLTAMSYDSKSIRLTWNVQSGIDGYELCRASSSDGNFKKIYTAKSAPTAVYINGLRINSDSPLTEGTEYFYKIRAYHLSGSRKIYSPYSEVVSAAAGDKDNDYDDPAFALYKQGDNAWMFCKVDEQNACLLTSYAIIIKNMGINCTPKTLYESNGNTRYMTSTSFANMAANFGVKCVPALSRYSPYFSGFDGTATSIKSPSKYAVSAIKEALNRNPEGVIVYFKNRRHKHAFVVCKYQGDWLYFSDPGTSYNGGGTHLVNFQDTWVSRGYKMSYRNLFQIIALDKIQ